MPRPATGKTPLRNIRVPDSLWKPAMEKAAAEGKTLTDVLITCLHRYLNSPQPPARDADSNPG